MAFSSYGAPRPQRPMQGQQTPTDQSAAPDAPQAPQRPQMRPQGAMQQQAPQPQPTFAQMQQNGQARPAPPMPPSQNPHGDLNTAVQQRLANPSAYTSQNAVDTYDRLNQRLGESYKQNASQLEGEMARRGLHDSTIAGQKYSDLATEQSRSQADLVQQLQTQAAQQYSADANNAITSGLGYGALGVSQGQLGLAQQQNQQQYGLAQQDMGLRQQLGLGNLSLDQQRQQDQNSQFAQQFGLQQRGQDQQYGLANRSLDQSANQFQQNYGLQQQAQQNQNNQFGQSFGLQQQALGQQGDAQRTQQILQALGLMGQYGADPSSSSALTAYLSKMMGGMPGGSVSPSQFTPTKPTPTRPFWQPQNGVVQSGQGSGQTGMMPGGDPLAQYWNLLQPATY